MSVGPLTLDILLKHPDRFLEAITKLFYNAPMSEQDFTISYVRTVIGKMEEADKNDLHKYLGSKEEDKTAKILIQLIEE